MQKLHPSNYPRKEITDFWLKKISGSVCIVTTLSMTLPMSLEITYTEHNRAHRAAQENAKQILRD